MARMRQSRLDFGLGIQVEVLETFEVVPSSLRSGPGNPEPRTYRILLLKIKHKDQDLTTKIKQKDQDLTTKNKKKD